MYSKLLILQHNIKTFQQNKELLFKFMYDNQVDIAMLSETWLKEKLKNTSSYTFVQNNRTDGYGGVGLIIKNNIHFKILNLPVLRAVEAVAIKTVNLKQNQVIISGYIPPRAQNSLVEEDLNNIYTFLRLEKNIIFGGDMNAHNLIWNSKRNCRRGKIIEKLLDEQNAFLLNDGSLTYIAPPGKTSSPIDLTWVSASLKLISEWKVVEENLGSDHKVILFSINNIVANNTFKKKIKIDEKKFKNYMDLLNTENLIDYDDCEHEMLTAIEHSRIDNRKLRSTSHISKPWWNDKLNEQKIIQIEALRKYNKYSTSENFLVLKREQAIFKRIKKKAKQSSWRNFAYSLTPSTPTGNIWKSIKKLNNNQDPYKRPIILENQELAEEFMRNNIKEDSRSIETHYISTPTAFVERYEKELSIKELNLVLKSKSNSAPGIDNISYNMIKLLSNEFKLKLLQYMNKFWSEAIIPGQWKITKLIPITKAGKDPLKAEGFRPIALIPAIPKTMNGMIKNRLEQFIEDRKIFSCNTYGFRKNHSTINCINSLIIDIKSQQAIKNKVVAIFIDISKAYDNVNPLKLKDVMEKKGIPSLISNWIGQFLINRVIKLEMNDESYIESMTSTGLPQGSCLSPILFNLYTNDIHDIVCNKTKIIQYADDFVILGWGSTIVEAEQNLQDTMDKIVEFIEKMDLSINHAKCSLIIFKRKLGENCDVLIHGNIIKTESHWKYLGMWLDEKLNFARHVNETVEVCKKKLNIVKMLSSIRYGSHPSILLQVYKAIVRSKIDYGVSIYGACSKSKLQKLDTIHNAGIRRSLGCLKTTPINAMLAEAGETPLNKRRQLLTRKEILKTLLFNLPISSNLKLLMNSKIKKSNKDLSYIETQGLQIKNEIFQTCLENRGKLEKPVNLTVLNYIEDNGKIIKKSDYSEQMLYKITKDFIFNTYPGYNKYYTDASKNEIGVGIAVVNQELEVLHKKRLNENFCIASAELIAIKYAVEEIKNDEHKYIVILTDSQASCKLLESHRNNNYLVAEIFKMVQMQGDKEIHVQWIPGHVNISGNVTADLAAKESVDSDHSELIKLTVNDGFNLLKDKIHSEWQSDYNEVSIAKGNYHFQIMPIVTKKPWFHQLKIESYNLKRVIRLRTNHALTKSKRFLFKLESTDKCSLCGVVEDLQHITINCPRFNLERSQYPILLENQCLIDILKENKISNYKSIIMFLHASNIEI